MDISPDMAELRADALLSAEATRLEYARLSRNRFRFALVGVKDPAQFELASLTREIDDAERAYLKQRVWIGGAFAVAFLGGLSLIAALNLHQHVAVNTLSFGGLALAGSVVMHRVLSIRRLVAIRLGKLDLPSR